ncbi:hypothetical protein QQS21_004446 [Conoideocrella luteorostrata]|uniref:Uncharacterized protein n=1 Tax=Conoideocrella luteorostrata TaxID=1105319 RepID=A0AAJ0CRD7_9HYPO|nr:hypothetical protein QQS21_004446 [Conoideocrella luteorostrata]
MFATQQYVNTVDSGRKRFRDDEEAANAATGFGEHRTKRLQSLPFRTSPRVSEQSLHQTIVPLNANPAEAGPRHDVDSWAALSFASETKPQHDAEVDMMDTVHCEPSSHDESTQQPALQHDYSAGRMPTPIQPSFAAQVRGQHGGWAAGQVTMAPNGIVNLGHQVTGLSQEECVPRAMASEAEWHRLQNNRRLPSPISEVGDSGFNGQTCISSDIIMDSEKDASHSQPPTSFQCPSSKQESPTNAMEQMEHPNAMMDADAHLVPGQHAESDVDPSSPSPGRKGHQRSKHTVNSWTWQPGMKKSFSIGYRSDCEKCRLKVPGHFNHIVIS